MCSNRRYGRGCGIEKVGNFDVDQDLWKGGDDMADFDPKKAVAARKAEMDQMVARLEEGVRDIFLSDRFKDYLRFCAKFPRYSLNNQLLIMLQRPDATMCQSYTAWKDAKRYVKKGEKGIRIFAPSPFKKTIKQERRDDKGVVMTDPSGKPLTEMVEVRVMAFKPVSTFDISQTEGEPLPELDIKELTGSISGYEKLLEVIKEVVPASITFEDTGTEAKGYYNWKDDRIVIRPGMGQAQTVKTLIHEVAHRYLHKADIKTDPKKPRKLKETEAEAVAYIVCQHFGIETSEYSFGYIATWAKDLDVEMLKESLVCIRNTASDLIVKIEEKIFDDKRFKNIDDFLKEHDKEMPFSFCSDCRNDRNILCWC